MRQLLALFPVLPLSHNRLKLSQDRLEKPCSSQTPSAPKPDSVMSARLGNLRASEEEPGLLDPGFFMPPSFREHLLAETGVPISGGSPTSLRNGRSGQRHHRRYHEHQGAGG